ncbi:MAG: branched-chain amino acid ABC transporter permease [Crenarchaeota archaeon]|nr:branched-chain amino acid ABC transporter permease [Thermoproteota archaeon]
MKINLKNLLNLQIPKPAELIHSNKFTLAIVTLAMACILPLYIRNEYFISEILTPIMIFIIYASAWNILAYSGQASLGHAAFLGIGGFVSALVAIKLGAPPIISLFIGAIFSSIIGLLIGLACVRLKTWFLAIVTFGFSVIAATIFSQFDTAFGGILGFPPIQIVESGFPLYYLTVAFATISVFVIYLIMKSKLGLAFKAIRENENEAKMTGINASKYRLIAFIISTFFAGLAGGLYIQSTSYIDLSIFSLDHSFEPLMMAVIGGLATIEGPIIGAIIIVAIQSYLPSIDPLIRSAIGPLFPEVSNAGPYIRLLAIGIFFIIMVIFAPKGVTSLLQRLYLKIKNIKNVTKL